MARWLVVGGVAYSGLALAGYLRSHVLPTFLRFGIREMFPEMLRGLWQIYPGRRWPGPLKLIGIPMAGIFVLTIGGLVIVAYIIGFVVFSPRAVWFLFQHRTSKSPCDSGPPGPAVEAQIKAAG